MRFEISADDIENVAVCPVCEAVDLEVLTKANVHGTTYLQTSICLCCGLTFRSKRPNTSWFDRSWVARSQKDTPTQWSIEIDERLNRRRAQRYRLVARHLRTLVEGKKHVDVGSGPGAGLVEFRDIGFDVTAIEPDPLRAQVGREKFGLNIISERLENCGLGDGFADLVTCFQVVEHLHRPKALLESISALVRPGGLVYIEVPDARNFVDWRDALYIEHMQNFSFPNLLRLADGLGLRATQRLFPKTHAFGVEHLAVVFVKEGVKGQAETKKMSGAELSEIKGRYRVGITGSPAFPIQYEVPELTDLAISVSPRSNANRLHSGVYGVEIPSAVDIGARVRRLSAGTMGESWMRVLRQLHKRAPVFKDTGFENLRVQNLV